MTYLEEAAAEVRRMLDANSKREEDMRHLDDTHAARYAIRAERLAIIDRLTAIAAIEARDRSAT